jgi:hypothetical protein
VRRDSEIFDGVTSRGGMSASLSDGNAITNNLQKLVFKMKCETFGRKNNCK